MASGAGDRQHFGQQATIQQRGNETGANALNKVRPCGIARKDGRFRRLDSEQPHRGKVFAQVAPCPRDGSACADARNKGIHRSGVREDFRTRRAVVRFRIIRIGELIQKYIAFRGGQPLGFLERPRPYPSRRG